MAATGMATFSPETLTVHTHDNVGIGYLIAGIGSRTLALLLDLLLGGVIFLVTFFGAFYLLNTLTVQRNAVSTLLGLNASATGAYLIGTIAFLAYFFAFEALASGRTPGKMAAGIRVIHCDGSALGLRGSLIRNAVRLIDVELLFVGALVAFISPETRRIGDYAAGTVVIRERRAINRIAQLQAPPPVYLRVREPGDTIIGMQKLGSHELSVLRAFLARPDLNPAQRFSAATAIAARLHERLGMDPAAPERSEHPEQFVERCYLQLERQRAQV